MQRYALTTHGLDAHPVRQRLVMRLNHLDLQVPDVQSTAAFFETLFGFTLQTSRQSPAIAILTGEDGFVLVVQKKKGEAEKYPEGFHLGFLVDDDQSVFRFHAAAVTAGLEVNEPSRNARGLMVYCRAPGDVLVEVSHRAK